MRKRSARKRRAEAGPPLVPDPREEIGGEEVDVGTLGLGFVGAGFAGIREIGVGVRTAEGESAIEHRRRVGPDDLHLYSPFPNLEKRERKWYLCHYLNIISGRGISIYGVSGYATATSKHACDHLRRHLRLGFHIRSSLQIMLQVYETARTEFSRRVVVFNRAKFLHSRDDIRSSLSETSKRNTSSGRRWTNVLLAVNVRMYIAQVASNGRVLTWGAKPTHLIAFTDKTLFVLFSPLARNRLRVLNLMSLVEAQRWLQLLLGTMNCLGCWRILLKNLKRLCFRESLGLYVLSKNYVPTKGSHYIAVKKALEMIKQNISSRSKSEGHDAYHFSLQLTGAPALIGTRYVYTDALGELQDFPKEPVSVSDEALTATRPRAASTACDIEI
ncbi:hypothetical protein Bca101_008004 [Brassica carinata]